MDDMYVGLEKSQGRLQTQDDIAMQVKFVSSRLCDCHCFTCWHICSLLTGYFKNP